MRKKSLYNILVCLSIFFVSTNAHSQAGFKYMAALDSVSTTGFYKINLPSEVVAKSDETLKDIRILDENDKQVSYIIKNDLAAFKKEDLTEFPILKYEKEKDKLTHIILKNASGKAVNELLLFIKNMDANRSFSVSGSDDSSQWFIIKENIFLENAFSNDGENVIKTLSFPKSNYNYLQLTISGENLLPFNITKAGIYNEDFVYGKYIEIPKPIIYQTDSLDKNTYIKAKFNDEYQINKIIIDVEGAKYFKRKIYIANANSYVVSKDEYVTSDTVNIFMLNDKTSQLNITINNADNNPLKVMSVKAFQLNVSLFTYLQGGKKYYLNFGDPLINTPAYDLAFFSDEAGKNPLEIGLKRIEEKKIKFPVKQSSWLANNKIILWIVIIAALLILSFFTLKMIKEIDKK